MYLLYLSCYTFTLLTPFILLCVPVACPIYIFLFVRFVPSAQRAPQFYRLLVVWTARLT